MNEASKVSVVIATYNGEKFLSAQLASILSQTFSPFEIIISDDSSDDRTLEIASSFVNATTIPIHILRNSQRLGYAENFLNATRFAKGDYVAFCDQDDIWLPSKLDRSISQLKHFNADLYVHAAELINKDGAFIGKFNQGISKLKVHHPMRLPAWGVFYGFSMVFRKDLIDMIDSNMRGNHTFEYSGKLSHDLWVYFLGTTAGRTVTDPAVLAFYRRHGDNETPEVKGNFLRSLWISFGLKAHPKLRRDRIAMFRAHIIKVMSLQYKNTYWRESSKKMYIYWKNIAKFEKNRIKLYTNQKIMERFGLMARLILSGAYLSSEMNGLGFSLLLKDFISGALAVDTSYRRFSFLSSRALSHPRH